MKLKRETLKMVVLAVSVLGIASAVAYAVNSVVPVQDTKGQAAVIQDGSGSGSTLGQSIKDLTQGIIAGTNEQVQNTLESAGQQALPQLQQNASQYDCLIVVMNFGKAHGAMTCSPDQSISTGITVNSQNAPGFSSQSTISRQGGSTAMQNQMSGSGSSANVIPGDVP